MNLREYQLEAEKTDQVPRSRKAPNRADIMVPLLGLAGEAGTLLTEYKKWLREGEAYQIFKERVAEELGDILWYIANIATKEHLNLDDIAAANLKKTRNRWLPARPRRQGRPTLFDENADQPVLNEDIARVDEIYLWFVTLKDDLGKKKAI
jgi:NTP pyrophosphatase (non-canonical NTP hydrolase)